MTTASGEAVETFQDSLTITLIELKRLSVFFPEVVLKATPATSNFLLAIGEILHWFSAPDLYYELIEIRPGNTFARSETPVQRLVNITNINDSRFSAAAVRFVDETIIREIRGVLEKHGHS